MTNRSANATIKGYFYQFDHTVIQLLGAPTLQSEVLVEGVEDVDLNTGDESVLIQCKYYEGTQYNHSVIKHGIIHMLRHFHASGCPEDGKTRYRIFGHYKDGQDKLKPDFDLEFLKKDFLTYEHEKVTHEVYAELGMTDKQLQDFRNVLEIDLRAPSYESQQKKALELLVSEIPGCAADDAEAFYYPNAINVVQNLAIKGDAAERRITKAKFIESVNRKDVVFHTWLQRKFGDDYYAKLIKKKHFKFTTSTRVPKASRIFAVDMEGQFDLRKAIDLLSKIGRRFSHKEHRTTPPQDRFCPYLLLRGVAPADVATLKEGLFKQGIKIVDGYPFLGSSFIPEALAAPPTKEEPVQLNFIQSDDQLSTVVSAITGTPVEIYDFYKGQPVDATHTAGVPHHKIKIDETYFINEIL